jgi:hypothetical protein
MQLSFSETCQGKVTKSRGTFPYFHNAIHTRCVQGKFGSVENHVSQSHIVDECACVPRREKSFGHLLIKAVIGRRLSD